MTSASTRTRKGESFKLKLIGNHVRSFLLFLSATTAHPFSPTALSPDAYNLSARQPPNTKYTRAAQDQDRTMRYPKTNKLGKL